MLRPAFSHFSQPLTRTVLPLRSTLSAPVRTMAFSPQAVTPRVTPARLLLGGAAALGVFGLGMVGATLGESTSVSAFDGTSSSFDARTRARLRDTFYSFGAGIGLTGASAALLWRSGAVYAMAGANPWVMFGVCTVGSIGSLLATMVISKENRLAKTAAFLSFNAFMGASIAPLALVGGPILIRAAAYTAAMVGSLAMVAANSPSEQFLWMAGPLSIGLGVVFVSSLGAMFLPATSAAGSVMSGISLYGGLGLFSAFVLFDTAKIIHHAETLPDDMYDPIRESLGIYLDSVNIFVRLASIMSGNRRK